MSNTTAPAHIPPAHVPVLHVAGDLPAATADVAKIPHDTSLENQRKNALAFFTFLTSPTPSFIRLNEGNQFQVALVSVPRTKFVKVVYGVGVGSSPIGSTPTPVEGKLLLLQRDGNAEFGPPQPLCLELTVLSKKTTAVMTAEQFSTAVTAKGATYMYPLVTRNAVTETKELMQLAPIPPYLLYDGFETDLDTAPVLERVMGAANTALAMFDHVKQFLQAFLSTNNAAENKPYVIGTEFLMAPSMASRRWAKTKFASCFLTLTSVGTTTAAVSTLPQG